MSQIGQFSKSNPFVPSVDFLVGNLGGPVGPDGSGDINIVGTGDVTVTGNPGTNTLTISIDQSIIGHSITGNTGGARPPSGGNWNLLTAHSNIIFAGAGSTETLDFALTSNILLGSVGAITSGTSNVAVGQGALASATSGSQNVALGVSALTAITTGSGNVAVGYNAGSSLTVVNSNNILIGSTGVVGDNGTTRIGTNGTQAKVFIPGIDGVNVGSVAKVVTLASDQLGTATITAGAGITVTPGANTITIASSGVSPTNYTNVNTSPYVVLITDEYLSVDSSGGPITVQLPNVAALSSVFIIKDRTGSAAINNITVTTVGGLVNIDGATSFVMNTAYQAINVIGNGSTYEIY